MSQQRGGRHNRIPNRLLFQQQIHTISTMATSSSKRNYKQTDKLQINKSVAPVIRKTGLLGEGGWQTNESQTNKNVAAIILAGKPAG